MNVKASIYRSYCWYFKHFPLQKGKSFFGRFLYKLLGNAVFSIDGSKFELSPMGFIDKYLLYTGEFDGEVLRQVKQSLKNGGTFIDIGANFGYYTVLAAGMPHTKVIAFEPSPAEAARLQRNLTLNRLQNVLLHQVALSDKSEERYLHTYGEGNTGMNSLLHTAGSRERVAVRCERFDQLIGNDDLKSCRLIKIDVEGFEQNVLKGMGALLEKFKGNFVIEMNYGDDELDRINSDAVYEILSKRGFVSKLGKRFATHYNDFFSVSQPEA
jgi:FkbM family methyltransferase